jgi:metal-responsive CopG/Arc/MetJ family transcriptional regulator
MTHKVAISISDHVFRRLERVRRARKLSRSAAIQGAVDRWLESEERSAEARAYVEGYRRVPEKLREIEAWTSAEAWDEYDGNMK